MGYSEVLNIHTKSEFYKKILFMNKICEEHMSISTCWITVVWVLGNGWE